VHGRHAAQLQRREPLHDRQLRPGGRCQHPAVANGTSCSDGNACNGTETCQAGVCTPGTLPNCNDNNPCTTDTCDAVFGCQHAPSANGISCSDGNVCNGSETCQAGVCTAGTPLNCNDGNVCTTDTVRPGAVPPRTCRAARSCAVAHVPSPARGSWLPRVLQPLHRVARVGGAGLLSLQWGGRRRAHARLTGLGAVAERCVARARGPFATGGCWQPCTGSQRVVVQTLPSLQLSGVPAVHTPA